MSVDEVIGTNVHHLMWEKHIRQRSLYDAMGVSRGSLHRKMRGEVAWLARDVAAAARVLGVDPGRLFEDREVLAADPAHVTGEYDGLSLVTAA
jgi:transcriptional regulator with XRE-family HTH domain